MIDAYVYLTDQSSDAIADRFLEALDATLDIIA
jgi:hypothetical protein